MIDLPRVAPGRGPFAAAGQMLATMRVEIAMQWRRWGLWLTFGCASALLLLLTLQAAIFLKHLPPESLYVRLHYTDAALNNVMIDGMAIYGAMFYGLAMALLIVDRLGRDRNLGMRELQYAAPQGVVPYALGKFLGNYVAVLAPALLGYLLCALSPLLFGWSPELFLMYLQAFLLVYVPSSLAAVGVALLLASVLPLRVVQVGFSLLWFEFNIGLGWHGLSFSIFNPSGLYVFPVFFPDPHAQFAEPDFHPSLQLAQLNIAVLILTAIVALTLTCCSLAFQRRCEERE